MIQGIKKNLTATRDLVFKLLTNEFFRKNTRDPMSSLQLVALTLKSH